MGDKLGRNTKLFGAISLLNDSTSEAIVPLLPFFITVILNESEIYVGIMESLAVATMGIFSLVSSFYIRKFGEKKKAIIAGYSFSSLIKTLFAFAVNAPQVVAIRFLDRVGKGVRDIPRDTLIALGEKKENLGRAYGFRQAMDSAGAIIGPLIASAVLYIFVNGSIEDAYRTTFFIAAIPAILSIPLTFMIRDIASKLRTEGGNIDEIKKVLSFERYKKVFSFGLVVFLAHFSVAFFILRAGEFVNIIYVPLLYLFYNIAYTLASYPVGGMADRFGTKIVGLGGLVLYFVSCLLFGYYPSLVALVAGFTLLGVFKSVIETIPRKMIVESVEEEYYPTSIGIYQGFTNLMGLPSNLIAGILYGVVFLGAPSTFAFGILGSIGASVLILWPSRK
ncbi:MFS transporter [Candidatus Micrarchaeota archaeon]|nr:MFS transporter [Candidatus Micrarchaeota archaeon]